MGSTLKLGSRLELNVSHYRTGEKQSRPFSISFQLQPEISGLISKIYTGWAVAPSSDSRHPTPAQQLGAARQKAACEPFAIYDALTIPGVFITILRKLKFYSFPPLSRQKSGLPLFICPNPLNKRSCKSGSCPQAINTWWNYRSAASLKLTFNLACLDDLGELFFSAGYRRSADTGWWSPFTELQPFCAIDFKTEALAARA